MQKINMTLEVLATLVANPIERASKPNVGFTRIGSRPILLFMREKNRVRLTCSKRLCGGFGDLEGYFASPTGLVFFLESNVVR